MPVWPHLELQLPLHLPCRYNQLLIVLLHHLNYRILLCRLIEMNQWSHRRLSESRDARYKKNQSCLHRTCIANIFPPNVHFYLRPPLLYAQPTICTRESPGSRGQTNVDELLRTIGCLSPRTQEDVTNSHQEQESHPKLAVWQPRLGFWERLNKSDSHLHHLRTQLLSMRDALADKESEFSTPDAECYRASNERHRFRYNTDYEQGTKSGQAIDYGGEFLS